MSPLLINNNGEEIVVEKDRRQSALDKLEEKLQKAQAKNSIVLTEEEKWKHFEETGILEDWQGKIVNISGEKPNLDATPINNEFGFTHTVDVENWKKFNGKKLFFKNCPNLKGVRADCLNLEGLKFEDCPNLERLSAYNNNFTELDLTNQQHLNFVDVNYNQITNIYLENCKNLEKLYCSNNQLAELNTDDCEKLRILNCSYNPIYNLKVNHLENLKILHCEDCYLIELDCEGLKKLEEIYCFDNVFFVKYDKEESGYQKFGLKILKIKRCISLRILDIAENNLEKLTLSNFPQLVEVALKENSLKFLTIEKCPELKLLDFSLQGNYTLNKEKTVVCLSTISTCFFIDECPNLEELLYTKGTRFSGLEYGELIELTAEDFSHLKTFECSIGITSNFDRRLDEKKQAEEEQQRETEMKQTDEEGNVYYTPTNEQLEESRGHLDLSWRGLSGNFRVANLKDLHTLNLGHNQISQVVIRNCPNLTKVILSHNGSSLTKAIIWNCPKLDESKQEQEGFWYYGNPNLVIEHADKDLKEAVSLKSDATDPTQPFQKEPDLSELTEKRILYEIACLIASCEKSLIEKDWPTLTKLVAEIKEKMKEISKPEHLKNINEYLTKFESALLVNNSEPNKNYWPWIISLIFITPILLGMIFLIIKKWVSYDFKKQISQLSKKTKR